MIIHNPLDKALKIHSEKFVNHLLKLLGYAETIKFMCPNELIIKNNVYEADFVGYSSKNEIKNIAENNSTDENPFTTNPTNIDFSYIPIKICLIGHSFSGRKTQAKLLCNKYPKLKYYSAFFRVMTA